MAAARLAALAVVVLLSAGCPSRTTSDRVLVFVDPPDARSTLARGGVWVDPRPRSRFEAGHVPGAVHLPFTDVGETHTRLDDRGTIIVYGDEYNDTLAIAMSKRLVELGHDDVRTLRGGLRAWESAGGELATGP